VDFARVGALAEIPEGEMRAYDLPVGRVAIAHLEHRLFAFGDECTHAGCSLAEGAFDDRAATVTCACHESVFDVETGEPIGGPAQDPVSIFAARVVDGWVEVASVSAGAVTEDSGSP
jgi:3-phenylpropionate/trans-cinnamate dioxygenase ferredoxin subunit